MNPSAFVTLYLLVRFVAWIVTMHFLFYSFGAMSTFTAIAVGFYMAGFLLITLRSFAASAH